jgi:hypothetical protein
VPIAEQDAREVGERIIAQGEKPEIDAALEAEIDPVDRLVNRAGGGRQGQEQLNLLRSPGARMLANGAARGGL